MSRGVVTESERLPVGWHAMTDCTHSWEEYDRDAIFARWRCADCGEERELRRDEVPGRV